MIKKQQLADQVIEHFRKAIASGIYPIGSRLPAEPQLKQELGVGRSTLREAIRVLAHNGTLQVRQGDGTYVRAIPINSEPLVQRLRRAKAREIQEVRRTLEIEIARLAATRHNKSDLKKISRLLKDRRKALASNDMPALLEADVAFHCSIAEASGNEVLSDLYRIFALTLREALSILWAAAEHDKSGMEILHKKLFNAIAARNGDLAAEITASLLDRHEEMLSGAGSRV